MTLLFGLQAALWGQGTAELNRRASEFYAGRQFDKAIAELQRSLALDARQIGPAKLLGLCYQLTGREEEAERILLKATQLDTKDAEAWFFLGRAHYARNFFDRAVAALETAQRLNPRSGRILEQLGLALEAAEQTERAAEAYEEALKHNPPPSAHLNYGMLLYKLNRLDESEAQLRRAKAADPQDWRACFELGKVYSRRRKNAEAALELEAALKMRIQDADQTARISHLLGQVYLRMGRDEDARKMLAEAETKP